MNLFMYHFECSRHCFLCDISAWVLSWVKTSQTYILMRQQVDCIGSIGSETLSQLVGAGVTETGIASPSHLSYPQGHSHVAKSNHDPKMAWITNKPCLFPREQ